jgi:ABC-type Fe3+-hydroxamate transport system substrate-binding protein
MEARRGAVASAVAIAFALLLAGCSSQAAKPAPTQTVTVTATETATYIATPTATITHQVQVKVPVPGPTKTVTKSVPQTYTTLSDGTYVVGTDIQPGVYKTAGPGSSAIANTCYWAVLNSLNTTDIADNGNISGPTTIQVDGKALELSGGCTWAKIG